MATTQDQIDALLFERAGYERRGLTDRIKQVDAALAAIGYEAPRATRADAPATSTGKRTTKA